MEQNTIIKSMSACYIGEALLICFTINILFGIATAMEATTWLNLQKSIIIVQDPLWFL